eukprot:3112476-Amphidinium_carterae.1
MKNSRRTFVGFFLLLHLPLLLSLGICQQFHCQLGTGIVEAASAHTAGDSEYFRVRPEADVRSEKRADNQPSSTMLQKDPNVELLKSRQHTCLPCPTTSRF